MTNAHVNTSRLAPAALESATTPLLRIIANNPRMVDLFRELTRVLVKESQLIPHERWLVTMRMAWRCNCGYEFGRKAADAATPEDMKTVVARIDSPELSATDRLLLEFTDQIHARQNIDQRVWEALCATRSPAYMVELTSLAGLYLMASTMANVGGAK